MLIRVGLEVLSPQRSLAWGLDFPGCFAYGSGDAEAILRFAANLINFEYWIGLHTDQPWFRLENVDFRIVEASQGGALPGRAEETIAFFQDELRPLSRQEIDHALLVHRWQREELLAGLEFSLRSLAGSTIMGQEQTIPRILEQLARTEHAYLRNLAPGLPPYPEAMEPLEALKFCRELVESSLPGLAENTLVVEENGELWSCRKLARRLLWNQRVRIDSIKAQLGLEGA